MTPTLSPDQSRAHDSVLDWHGSSQTEILTMGGYAGCGKSFLMAHIAKTLKRKNKKLRIGFACFTGKASLVLRGKLIAAGVLDEPSDFCGTIHRMIYKPVTRKGVVIRWDRVAQSEFPYDVIFLDESSMISADYLTDLQSYGRPIFAVGDHGQLPPVKGSFNLMENPILKLEKIHRQAENSPIIRVSMLARLEGYIPVGNYGPGVFKTTNHSLLEQIKDPKDGMVLCGTNRTRGRINAMMRRRLGYSGQPQVGETLVCLKNQHQEGTYNGMVGELTAISDECPLEGQYDDKGALLCVKNCEFHYTGTVRFEKDDVTWHGAMLKSQFGASKTIQEHPNLGYKKIGGLFDWGYSLTAWKAQGAEWRNVLLVEETGHMDDDLRRRFLYTCVTRASQKLAIIGH